jgi:hypothetical protein
MKAHYRGHTITHSHRGYRVDNQPKWHNTFEKATAAIDAIELAHRM